VESQKRALLGEGVGAIGVGTRFCNACRLNGKEKITVQAKSDPSIEKLGSLGKNLFSEPLRGKKKSFMRRTRVTQVEIDQGEKERLNLNELWG